MLRFPLTLALALAGTACVALVAVAAAPAGPTRPEAAAPGHWTLSGAGILTWTTDGSAAPVPTGWYLEHSKQVADIQANIDCQIAACASR